MNEQAIQDAYNLFVQNGYKKSIDEFKSLIASNPQALQDSYNLFVGQGYKKGIDDYKALMGLSAPQAQPSVEAPAKKKDITVSSSAGGSLAQPESDRIAVGPMGIMGLERGTPAPPAPKKEEAKEEDRQGWLMNTVSALDRGFYKNLIGSPVKGLGTALEGITGKGFVSDALIKFGDYFNNAIDELTPQDEDFKGSLTDQFGQAFGQVASLIATGGIAGAAGKGATAAGAATTTMAAQAVPKAVTAASAARTLAAELATPTAVSAGLSMGQSEFDRAKQAGATDEQAYEAFYKNAAVGSVLEKIPVMQFMKRFNKASAGGVVDFLKTKGVAGVTGGVEEMTTEVLQQLYANKTAQDIYNINQDIFEGVGESGGVGFGVGFLLNAMGANVKLLRQQGREREANMVEAQIAEIESQAQRGGPSSYSINGIKVESPQVINDMIDNLTASDLSRANISIENDPELSNKLQEKIVTSSIREQVLDANPSLSDESVDKIVELEKELRKVDGNTTQSGKDRAAAIRLEIKNIQNAVQEQSTDAGVLRREGPEVGLQQVGEGDQGAQVIAGGTEVITEPTEAAVQEGAQPVVSSKTQIAVAPFFNTQVRNTSEAATLRQSPEYKSFVESLQEIGRTMGVTPTVFETIGGYKNEAGEEIVEISNFVELEGATIEQAEEFAALASALAPQVQEAAIAAQYTEKQAENHNANEYTIIVSDVDGALDALKEAGITDFSVNEQTGAVSFIDVLDFMDFGLQEKIGTFIQNLNKRNIQYEQSEYRPLDSRRIGKGDRKKVLGRVRTKGTELGQGGQGILQAIETAVARDAEFQRVKPEEYFKPRPGNRLFNEPIKAVAEIADRYFQRVFGRPRPKYYGSRKIDKERAKRISDAYIAMVDDPTNPRVKEAYEALAKETIEQYKAFLEAGYVVEVNNNEPYDNSQDMVEDLRTNKRIKIFSTESGFGDEPITEKQRAENPLLRDSGYTDVNGQKLLVNDVFRAIHDFFGHSELGNSFGPIGEENAWNVHARMFSPLARAAMTSETRGQNSYVNFSGVNKNVDQIRAEARRLRQEGKEEEAKALVSEIYDKGSFADQKNGLLPEEFYQIDETDIGDADRVPQETVEDILTADTKEETTLEKVLNFLDKAEKDLDAFGRSTAGMNISIPVMKAIIKTLKALVRTGITLQEAIARTAAENNVSEQDVVDSINALAQQRAVEAKPEGVSEIELPGYNRMIGELEGVIDRSLERGATQQKAMDNAIAYLQGSRVYEDASDTQREQMVRDVRRRFGKREKPAPKPDKLFGEAKDVKMITMSEYELLKKQLSDKARGAREAIRVWRSTSNALAKYLKTMVKGGFINTKQAAVILRKFSGVNMLDEQSISKFVDYMERVFKNAEYAEQIAQVRSALPLAKKNTDTKIGIAEGLKPLLKRVFAINPTLIPESVFNKYVGLVEMMGQRRTVLELEDINDVTETANEVLNAVDEELSLVDELAERFRSYPGVWLAIDGEIDFAGTIRDMIRDGVITEEEAKIMRKYKSMILPKVERQPQSEAEIEAEKDALVQIARVMSIDYQRLPTQDERDLARALKKAIASDGIKELDVSTLKNLIRTIDNINNGYLPHFAELLVERIDAKNNSKGLTSSVMGAKPLALSTLYSRVKAMLTKNQNAFSELIRRNPLYYIDQVFGDFKTKNIFKSILEGPSEAQSQFKKAVTELRNKLEEAEQNVAKSFKLDPNKTLRSKFKMMTYMLELENQSNPESNKVNPAAEYLKKTITHINAGRSSYNRKDAQMLQGIYDEFVVDGKVDIDKLYASFNSAEKNAIRTIQNINAELREKAVYTAAIIRGDKINPLNDYVHHNTLHEHRPDEDALGTEFVNRFNDSILPSTKAKSLIERTGAVTPLNFDVFASATRGAKYVLMDYYMTPPIRTSRKTINETRKSLEANNVDAKTIDVFNAIDNAFEEAISNLLTENFTSTSIGEDAVNYISKQGYRAILASAPRFVAELASNVSFAMIAFPKDFSAGTRLMKAFTSSIGPNVMTNVKSKEIGRMYPKDTLSGRLIDPSIMDQASGVRGGRSKSDVANKMQQIYNLSLKKYLNFVETTADALISTPDKIVMRSVWFGAFSNEFKKQSGEDIDLEKVSENDEAYMSQNKEALDKAREVADAKAIYTGAADNAFMGILKGTPKANQSAYIRAFNMFNNFMTRFLIYEYVTARTGIYAMVGNGSISRKQGAALLGAAATRMTLYTVLAQTLSNALVGMFVDDEDEDDEKSLMQKIGQSMASSFSGLLIGRDFGNATKALLNYGIEMFNEKYLDFLREGKYDPYDDALQYTVIPPSGTKKKTSLGDLLLNMMGPFTPTMKTGAMIFKNATAAPKKEQGAIARASKEKEIRIPLEVLGNLGMIPLYKDIRKIVNAEIYKDLDNAEKKKPMNKMGKEDMKRYAPELYKELYGPGGTLYESEKIKQEIRREKERLKRQMKDEMYNYVPK